MTEQSNKVIPPQPGILTYTRPFRLVLRDEYDVWNPSIDDINNETYDYVKLHRISTGLDIGLPPPLNLLICFDGSFVLPAIKEFISHENAVAKFNQVLGEIVLGGVYFEPVEAIHIARCTFYPTGYIRAHPLRGELHTELRTTFVSQLNSILLMDPPTITALEIYKAREKGLGIINVIKNLTVNFIVHGVSSFVGNHWSDALSNFWISIEQVVSFLWYHGIVRGDRQPSISISGRKEFLDDNRTWTTAVRIEMLYQKSALDEEVYQLLNQARKSRNNLIHKGTPVTRSEANAAFDALFYLISKAVYNDPSALKEVIERYKQLDPITRASKLESKRVLQKDEVKYWMEAPPPIPGEKEWKDKPYEDSSDEMRPVETQ